MATFDENGIEVSGSTNPLPGRYQLETRPDGTSVFVYGLNPGDSANSVAALFTIGGNAYGPAIANFNGWDWPASDYAAAQHGARLVVIPAEWLKPSYLAKYGVFQPVADAVESTVDAGKAVLDSAGNAIAEGFGVVTSAGKWIVIGLVALALIEIFGRIPKPASVERAGRRYVRRTRRRVARRAYRAIAGD